MKIAVESYLRIPATLAIVSTLAACVTVTPRPDAVALLEAQAGVVTVKRVTDPASHATLYKIEICPTSDCDMFQSSGALAPLADYAYLYSAYIRRYRDHSKARPDGYPLLPFVDAAINKGYAKQTLDYYAAQYRCGPAKDVRPCVMQALRAAAGIQHMTVRYQDGMRIEVLDQDNY